MILTRNTLISAAVVGVIVVGGVSIAAAASAGRIEQARRAEQAQTVKTVTKLQPAERTPTRETITVSPAPDDVVAHSVTDDPAKIAEYWTEQRLQQAEPLPMPVASLIAPTD
ncbi:hypothetical protein J5X84_20870 [Streptosporangiaceae bacterium NEAU-GS5]|nr:hypothetical protein [Streptosporangiaceae bacterium NEAU-GS5]